MPRGRVLAGIDVGTDKVCTVIATVSPDGDAVSVTGVASHESSGLKKSEIRKLEDTIESITESVEAAERMAGYTISNALVSLSGAHIQSKNSNGVVAVAEPESEITPEDVARVIDAARAISLPGSVDILHVIPRYFTVDSQEGIKDPAGMTGVRLEAQVHLITGASTAMRNLGKSVAEVGINVQSLVFAGLASSYATLTETEKELGVVLVDIGAGTTSLCIWVEGALSYSSVIPIGASNITRDLAIGMRVSLSSAEKIKIALSKMPEQSPEEDREKDVLKRKRLEDKIDLTKLGIKEEVESASRKTLVEGIIRPRLNEMFTLIGNEIKASGFAGQTPAGVVITGGGAETISIVEACKRTLSLPARVGSPKGLTGLVEEIQTPAFATVTGLILFGLRHEQEKDSCARFSGLSGVVSRLPGKGAVNRALQLLKSLLP